MKRITKNTALQGELFVILEVGMWSLFPIISILALTTLSPLYAAALSTLGAAAFFAVVITLQRKWKEFVIWSAWPDILLATMIIGVFFYALFFIGLQETSAGNAGIIALMEVFFSMFILGLWKKESLIVKHKIGAALMVFGALFVLFPGKFEINSGDLIIFAAAAIPPIGNYFAQRARKKVSSNMIMFIRSLLAGGFLLLLAIVIETAPSTVDLWASLGFILINGIFVFGLSKVFWLEAIHRISITKATALNALSPALTLIIAFFVLQEIPTIWQVIGFIPMFIGVLILTEYKFLEKS